MYITRLYILDIKGDIKILVRPWRIRSRPPYSILKVRLRWFEAGLVYLRYLSYLSWDLDVLCMKRKVIFSSIMQYKYMCNQYHLPNFLIIKSHR